jgi:hypothetical protein
MWSGRNLSLFDQHSGSDEQAEIKAHGDARKRVAVRLNEWPLHHILGRVLAQILQSYNQKDSL